MKRSRNAVLVLMGASPLLLASCGGETESEAAYTTVEHCVKDGGTQESCLAAYDKAQAEHLKSAPRYATREECAAQHGDDQCEERPGAGGGGSFFVPFMSGFFISQILNRSSTPTSYYSSPLYRSRGGGYMSLASNSDGESYGRSRALQTVTSSPNHAVTHSRGGFGSSSSAHSSSRGS